MFFAKFSLDSWYVSGSDYCDDLRAVSLSDFFSKILVTFINQGLLHLRSLSSQSFQGISQHVTLLHAFNVFLLNGIVNKHAAHQLATEFPLSPKREPSPCALQGHSNISIR